MTKYIKQNISELAAPTSWCKRCSCQTDEIPLLPPQPTHISPPRMCYTTGKSH